MLSYIALSEMCSNKFLKNKIFTFKGKTVVASVYFLLSLSVYVCVPGALKHQRALDLLEVKELQMVANCQVGAGISLCP